MSWDKIENHLFEKYCIEGEDKELCKLMEEHDKEIRDKAIEDFINKAFEQFTALGIEDSYATVTECKMILREIAEKMKEVGE